MVSNVTPSSLGVGSWGTTVSFILISGISLNSLVSGVKSVTVDFVGETCSSLSSRNVRTSGMYLFMASARPV